MRTATLRLAHLGIAPRRFQTVEAAVAGLGAVQAQDFEGTKWALGLRVGCSLAEVERAIESGHIVRSWPMRGTLHFVAAADLRWMLRLMAPRVLKTAERRQQQLGLDSALLKRSAQVFEQALSGGPLTREQLLQQLQGAGIGTTGQRGYHLLSWWAQQGLICLGPPQGKQQTFVLLEQWLPAQPELSRERALAEIALRYFQGHGPASLADLSRWTGLALGDCRQGLAAVSHQLEQGQINGQHYWWDPACQPLESPGAYLLAGFDEYLLGYKDRSAVLQPRYHQAICPGNNGMFSPTLVDQGQVIGTWKRQLRKQTLWVSLTPFQPLRAEQLQGFERAAQAYAQFWQMPLKTEILTPLDAA